MIPSYYGSKRSINNVVACPARSLSTDSAPGEINRVVMRFFTSTPAWLLTKGNAAESHMAVECLTVDWCRFDRPTLD